MESSFLHNQCSLNLESPMNIQTNLIQFPIMMSCHGPIAISNLEMFVVIVVDDSRSISQSCRGDVAIEALVITNNV